MFNSESLIFGETFEHRDTMNDNWKFNECPSGVSLNHFSEKDIIIKNLMEILNNIPEGVIAVDLNMNVTFINQIAERITGMNNMSIIDEKCHDIFKIHKNECVMCQTIETGKRLLNCYICTTDNNGNRIPIIVSTAPLRDENGIIVGGVMSFRNLSRTEIPRRKLSSDYTFHDIIGQSSRMRELFELIPKIAQSESTVLIEGESGTGKELVAKAIHNASPRHDKPMICVNTNAIPDSLFESELFGYKAGAFTGATNDKKGRFALADGGSLFLDEIGYISQNIQTKLLRVLQEREYEPLGGTKSIKANVRIITATNRNLTTLMKSGEFREDLFYRLNVIKIRVPPLRERREDVPLIIDYFIDRFNRMKNLDISGISPSALNILKNHHYPGNVRELENIIEHAFALCPGGEIEPEYFPDYLQEKQVVTPAQTLGSLEEMESIFLTSVLKRNDWSRDRTARELGISSSTLYRKLKRLGLSLPYSEKQEVSN